MKAILFLLLFAFIYSIPNVIYTIKDCLFKIASYQLLTENKEIADSIKNDLHKWKVEEFWEKMNKYDPTIRPKVEECVKEANGRFKNPPRKH